MDMYFRLFAFWLRWLFQLLLPFVCVIAIGSAAMWAVDSTFGISHLMDGVAVSSDCDGVICHHLPYLLLGAVLFVYCQRAIKAIAEELQ